MAKNNYFDEKYVTSMLLEYQNSVETIEDEKGHKIVINKTPRIEQLETQITIEIMKVIKAVIFLYHYQIYMEYDELESLGIQACFQNYLKFDPKYGSAFNFFSLIVKKCLYGVTTRNSKKREKNVYLEDLGDAVHAHKETNIDEFVDNLQSTLHEVVDENFLGKKRQKYNLVSDVICDYLRKTKAYISKTDMYRFCGCYSIRALDVRQYMQDMKEFYPNLTELIDENVDEAEFSAESTSSMSTTGGGVEE